MICWCLLLIRTHTLDSPLWNWDKLKVLNPPQPSLLISFLFQQLLKDWIHDCHFPRCCTSEMWEVNASFRGGVGSTALALTHSPLLLLCSSPCVQGSTIYRKNYPKQIYPLLSNYQQFHRYYKIEFLNYQKYYQYQKYIKFYLIN